MPQHLFEEGDYLRGAKLKGKMKRKNVSQGMSRESNDYKIFVLGFKITNATFN